jgi:hypothetical protein
METGLLWYDDSQADFANKVKEAAQRYREKGYNPADTAHTLYLPRDSNVTFDWG